MKIRTCPFCGQLPKVEGLMKGTDLESYFIKCSNEKCEAAIKNPFWTIEEAVDYWNTRVEPEVRELEDEEDTLSLPDGEKIKMEAIQKLNDKIVEKYGSDTVFSVLFLMSQIDVESWTFPARIRMNTHRFEKLLDEIEADDELKEAFQKVSNVKE